MTGVPEHQSMKFLERNGEQLATEPVATALAEMVLKNYFGEEEFKAQQPLRISEAPDRWIIEGSRVYNEAAPRNHEQLLEGVVEMEILKRNCQIVKLSKKVTFAP
jgi:hypothetical protein